MCIYISIYTPVHLCIYTACASVYAGESNACACMWRLVHIHIQYIYVHIPHALAYATHARVQSHRILHIYRMRWRMRRMRVNVESRRGYFLFVEL